MILLTLTHHGINLECHISLNPLRLTLSLRTFLEVTELANSSIDIYIHIDTFRSPDKTFLEGDVEFKPCVCFRFDPTFADEGTDAFGMRWDTVVVAGNAFVDADFLVAGVEIRADVLGVGFAVAGGDYGDFDVVEDCHDVGWCPEMCVDVRMGVDWGSMIR